MTRLPSLDPRRSAGPRRLSLGCWALPAVRDARARSRTRGMSFAHAPRVTQEERRAALAPLLWRRAMEHESWRRGREKVLRFVDGSPPVESITQQHFAPCYTPLQLLRNGRHGSSGTLFIVRCAYSWRGERMIDVRSDARSTS